ncbi:MAG: CvpA family protein [Deltaproteobacteria bacterium]|nr:CvpA family protein [Deltaproteobacteria bacterium]
MSYLDIAFLVFFVIIMIRGFFRGFIKEAISILGVFFAYYGASYVTSKYYDSYYLSGIAHRFNNQEFGKIAVFTAVFLLTVIVFAVISFVLTKIIDLVRLGFCNRMGGFFLPELKPFYY